MSFHDADNAPRDVVGRHATGDGSQSKGGHPTRLEGTGDPSPATQASGAQDASERRAGDSKDARPPGNDRERPQEAAAEGPKTAAGRPQGTWRFWGGLFVQPILLLGAGALLIAGLGAAQRMGWISAGGAGDASVAAAESNVEYICPMMCVPPQELPGRCAVCAMELVPATSGNNASDGHSIQIDPAARRLANISTVTVESVPQARRIRAVGEIRYDEGALATISAYVDGRIDRLYADYTGMAVRHGDQLAWVYSPELYSGQVELLQIRRSLNNMQADGRLVDSQQRLYRSGRQRLIELGMTEAQVDRLEETGEATSRVHLYAPMGGTVIERLAVEGQYVDSGDPIYRIADLSQVWLMLDLFPADAATIRYGQRVEAEVQSLPGERFTGRVAFIDPVVQPRTRTVGVRVVLQNERGLLRIGDYARAHIEVDLSGNGTPPEAIYDPELAGKWISPRHPHVVEEEPGSCRVCSVPLVPASHFGFADAPTDPHEVLVIPRNAVLMTGRTSIVYVETEPGRFEMRPVVLGPSNGDRIVIARGLEAGEEVALSGNFLIDSQMQLAGNPSLIDPTRAQPRQEETEGPLQIERRPMERIAGQDGADLEQLYQAYFEVQATLADDREVPEVQTQPLHQLAERLAASAALTGDARELLEVIAEHAPTLSELGLDDARMAFKPVSKSIIQLASQARSAEAETVILHYYCPMVPGGEGDWLQPSPPLANPYWGSGMLRCGIQVRELTPSGPADEDDAGEPACCSAA